MNPRQQKTSSALGVALGLLLLACGEPLIEPAVGANICESSTSPRESGERIWLPPNAGCELDLDGHSLLLSTTDGATGALTFIDTTTKTVALDVALGTSDAIPFWHQGRAYVVHRHQFDFIDVLVPGQVWTSVGQHNIETPAAAAPNPHSIAFGPDGLAYVPLFATDEVRILDLDKPPGASYVGELDLSEFADADGSPEPSLSLRCGDTLLVSLAHLDTREGFIPLGGEEFAVFDLETREPLDLEPATPGIQGLPLIGRGLKQLRRDPKDPSGLTLLGLSSGIERIDLHKGTTSWLVEPSVFADANLGHPHLPVAFDINTAGTRAYISAYAPADGDDVDCCVDLQSCFAQARLYSIDLDTPEADLVSFAQGYDIRERTLEVVGDELWFGSTRSGSPGLWVFDLTQETPSLLEGFEQPLFTGLPPYNMTLASP